MITICSQLTALKLAQANPKTLDIIFISNPNNFYQLRGTETITDYARTCLLLAFDDVDHDSIDWEGPKKEHVQQALDFAKDKEDLIVCCSMGISRSSATAFIIAASRGSAEEALKLLNESHWPNRSIIKHGSELLNKPEICDIMDKWKSDYNLRFIPPDEIILVPDE